MPHPTGGAVVLLSGGLDSSVLLHHEAQQAPPPLIHALSYNYGQRHSRELDCAREQAVSAGAAHHVVIDISFLGRLLHGGSTLLTGSAPVPDLSALPPEALTQPPTYVPNRNMMLLSMAAAYAEAHGITNVYYGAQAHDEYGYWDCTQDFLDRINAVLALNRKQTVRVHAPFVAMSKAALVTLGMEVGVDFAQTWSCYRGEDIACGTCPTCVERRKAFAQAGVADPLPYLS